MIEEVPVGDIASAKTSGRYKGERYSEVLSALKRHVDAGDTLSYIEPADDEADNPQLLRTRLRRAAKELGVEVNVRGAGKVGEFVILRGGRDG